MLPPATVPWMESKPLSAPLVLMIMLDLALSTGRVEHAEAIADVATISKIAGLLLSDGALVEIEKPVIPLLEEIAIPMAVSPPTP